MTGSLTPASGSYGTLSGAAGSAGPLAPTSSSPATLTKVTAGSDSELYPPFFPPAFPGLSSRGGGSTVPTLAAQASNPATLS